jgi:hypothetical protein
MRHEKEPDTSKDVFIDGNHVKGGNWIVCMDATPETSAVYYWQNGYTYCSFLSQVKCFTMRKLTAGTSKHSKTSSRQRR